MSPRPTSFKSCHEAAGGKLVDFAGWLLPVQYEGILPEHLAVRCSVGMFDISHMGQVIVSGPPAWLEGMLTNRLSKLAPSQGQYTLMLNENGGVIDDLIIYRLAENEFFLVVNASRREQDVAWLKQHATPDISITDQSDATAGLAIQGPQAVSVFEKWAGITLPPRNGIAQLTLPGNAPVTLCRTGYTGEDGFELFCANNDATTAWNALLSIGVKPCGLGARDSLRLEMGYPLNGNDLNEQRTPIEAGLGFFCDLEKDFIGVEKLRAQKSAGGHDKLMGFKMVGTCPPPRSHYPVYAGEQCLGESTSGGFGPTVGCGIGMTYLPTSLSAPDTEITIEIRGRQFPAVVTKRPFHRPQR